DAGDVGKRVRRHEVLRRGPGEERLGVRQAAAVRVDGHAARDEVLVLLCARRGVTASRPMSGSPTMRRMRRRVSGQEVVLLPLTTTKWCSYFSSASPRVSSVAAAAALYSSR